MDYAELRAAAVWHATGRNYLHCESVLTGYTSQGWFSGLSTTQSSVTTLLANATYRGAGARPGR